MTQRFNELYIARVEHQKIIAYYQKLVAHMFQKLRSMDALDSSTPAARTTANEIAPVEESGKHVDQSTLPGNVVRVDFRQRRP
ncbi:hypothetical protein [Shinella sumterensis]|uniref:hypothetical protein n=2 Tax=Shinella TaxID=323620 RepID=UPI003F843D0F